jgi:guanylate kinase
MLENGAFIEYMKFNGWYYGQTEEDFNGADVMIMSKDGLDILPEQYRKQCAVIYLDIDRLTRIERLNDRDDKNDSIQRRMDTDDEQFENFTDFEIRIKNADF